MSPPRDSRLNIIKGIARFGIDPTWAARFPMNFWAEPGASFIVEWDHVGAADGEACRQARPRIMVRGFQALVERMGQIIGDGWFEVTAIFIVGQLSDEDHRELAEEVAAASCCPGPGQCHGIGSKCEMCGDVTHVCKTPDCPIHWGPEQERR